MGNCCSRKEKNFIEIFISRVLVNMKLTHIEFLEFFKIMTGSEFHDHKKDRYGTISIANFEKMSTTHFYDNEFVNEYKKYHIQIVNFVKINFFYILDRSKLNIYNILFCFFSFLDEFKSDKPKYFFLLNQVILLPNINEPNVRVVELVGLLKRYLDFNLKTITLEIVKTIRAEGEKNRNITNYEIDKLCKLYEEDNIIKYLDYILGEYISLNDVFLSQERVLEIFEKNSEIFDIFILRNNFYQFINK